MPERRRRWAIMSPVRVALVHDYLTQRGGAERVVLALARAFPDAPLTTSFYDPDATFPEFRALAVRTAPINRIRPLRRAHRLALPLLAPTFSALRIDADVVVCSSSGWAHGVRTAGHKVVYCHAPARWLYQTEAYTATLGRAARAATAALRPALVAWDRRAAGSAAVYVANSRRTRDLVRAAYGVDAEVVHPPYGLDPRGPRAPVPGLEPGFFVCVARLLAYKRVDVVIDAFAGLPDERLVVVGTGPDEAALRARAPANVTFLAEVGDDELRWLYASAEALVGASAEDFGLTPLEAAALGTPSVVLRFGGYLETVVDERTGVFFDEPSPGAVRGAIHRLRAVRPDPSEVRAHAERFGEPAFAEAMRAIVTRVPGG
jgi:glycosyltransferase involved in cell wall biosynthesis